MSDGSFDGVALSGFAHVFSYVRTFIPGSPPIADPFRIQINLDQVSGVGNVTGFRYQGTGAFRINLPTAPIDPINVSFDLVVAGVPPNPIVPSGPPILPLDIVFLVNFPRGYAEQFFYPVDLRARALAPGRSPHMGEAIVGWVEAYFADTHHPKRWFFNPPYGGKRSQRRITLYDWVERNPPNPIGRRW